MADSMLYSCFQSGGRPLLPFPDELTNAFGGQEDAPGGRDFLNPPRARGLALIPETLIDCCWHAKTGLTNDSW